MPREPITNIPQSLTSVTAECLVVRDNCVASKQASKQAKSIIEKIVRAKARLVSFAVGCSPMADEAGRAFCVFIHS